MNCKGVNCSNFSPLPLPSPPQCHSPAPNFRESLHLRTFAPLATFPSLRSIAFARRSFHRSVCPFIPFPAKGIPRLESKPDPSYFFDPNSSAANSSFLSLPCSSSGSPPPIVQWFLNGGDEVSDQSMNTLTDQ